MMNKQQIPAKLAAIIQKKPCNISVNRIGFLLVFNIHDHFKYARVFFNMYTSRAGLYKKTSVRTSYLCCSIFLPKIPEI